MPTPKPPTIWKFPLAVSAYQYIDMPAGARLLSAQMQGDTLCLWAQVDPDARTEPRLICVLGTGHPILHELGEHLGTFQLFGGTLVFHVFEGTP